MRLSVRGIQSQPGKKVQAEFVRDEADGNARWLDGALETDGPVRLQVTATNLGGRIGLDGRLTARVKVVCSRCAQDHVLDLDEPIHEVFVRQGGTDDRRKVAREGSDLEWMADPLPVLFEEDEVDERPYWGDALELDDLARETLLLAVPMKPMCREDCRGLCPVCGEDRNKVQCSCREESVDPRLAPLQQWLESGGGTGGPLSN